ncbi:nucleotidyltransferase domain-containing protein [Massilia cavernae]|uniref:Nucleotidyltransferase domain-containing protein n=1 Tax=Massilia cavernae TaxID=2320864 RepID=A0A418Y5V7_9BURK|nr:nucleotidyltransferase domain-containing protein [Massilia cavernae]RJG22522.1 nucleotidyltransferase domain-containing protein [Massilia cavernae]
MSSHIYAFGSICRGEITRGSDIDVLACIDSPDDRFDSEIFSVYTYDRLREMWTSGNPFAWHLATESTLLFSSDGTDFLKSLGVPKPYLDSRGDCEKFQILFSESLASLRQTSSSRVFNLSSIFLSIRNFATCYSLGAGIPMFSRRSAFAIDPPAPIDELSYSILERARILATRGIGADITGSEVDHVLPRLFPIDQWMRELLMEIK